MPHKHIRRDGFEKSLYDLPPDVVARPLNTNKAASQAEQKAKSKKKRTQSKNTSTNDYGHDDTPKAFKRLMQAKTGPSRNGLDDGSSKKGQKRKRGDEEPTAATAIPKILPGERMSDYSARVDHALPVAGLVGKAKKLPGVKEHMTKHEKHLRRLQAGWRKEEAAIREKEEEAREQAEEEEDELKALLKENKIEMPVSRRKSRKQKIVGEEDDGDDDPWAALALKRDAPAGLHDVVQAPPQFSAVPKEKFKVKNGARVAVHNIPNAVGSLKKREELGQTRKDIIASYRELMRNKKNEA